MPQAEDVRRETEAAIREAGNEGDVDLSYIDQELVEQLESYEEAPAENSGDDADGGSEITGAGKQPVFRAWAWNIATVGSRTYFQLANQAGPNHWNCLPNKYWLDYVLPYSRGYCSAGHRVYELASLGT